MRGSPLVTPNRPSLNVLSRPTYAGSLPSQPDSASTSKVSETATSAPPGQSVRSIVLHPPKNWQFAGPWGHSCGASSPQGFTLVNDSPQTIAGASQCPQRDRSC